jgi:hypothetical protein
MGLGTTSGGPGRTTALGAPRPAAAAPRDTSPISARSARCHATVRPPKAPGLPAGRAPAFRALRGPALPPRRNHPELLPHLSDPLDSLYPVRVKGPSNSAWSR